MAGRSVQLTLLAVYFALASFFAALAARGFLVPLIAHELGADRLTVGLLFTVSTLAGAVLSIPSGFLADRFGRREIVILGALLAGASQLGIAFTADVRVYLAMQFIGGFGAAAAQTALYATVVDHAPPGKVGRAMGWMTLSMQVGFLAGPALAGVISPFTTLRIDLVLTTGLCLVPIAASFFLGPNRHRRQRHRLLAALGEVVRTPGFLPIAVGLFGATMLWGTAQAYLPLFGREHLGLSPAAIGYMLTLQAFANGASRIPGGRIVDRSRRRRWIVAIGTSGYAIAMLLLPRTSGFWAPTLLLVAGVPFLATAFIALGVVFSRLGSAAARGTAMGVYSAVLFGGLAAGPAVFGTVMQRGGYATGFTACAAASAGLSALMLMMRAVESRARGAAVLLPPAAPGT